MYPSAGSNKTILDYDVYMLDIEAANSTGVDTWQHEYAARAYFNLTDLSAASWSAFAELLATNDTVFDSYYAVHTVQCARTECTSHKCRRRLYCAAVHFTKIRFDACLIEE